MGLIIRVLLLVGLVKLLLVTDKPVLCAGIFAGLGLLFRLTLGQEIVFALVATAIGFGLAWLYFWLLYRTQEGFLFWVIMVVGVAIGVV